MTDPRINGLRSIELGVHDLHKSAEFYRRVWALEDVAAEGDTIHLRGTSRDHHVLTLRERPRAGLLGVTFSAPDRATIDALHAKAKAMGAKVADSPEMLEKSAGGGYGFRVSDAGGPSDRDFVRCRRPRRRGRRQTRPTKLTHVVLNSAQVESQTKFFLDVLGFKWSDSTFMMDFVRCCSDHHSVALARGNGPSLNHMAYEMPDIDGLMRGAGRVRKSGYEIMWGVGRHGPGSNVFSYFVEPNGFVTEYTTEVEQVGDNYVGHDCRLVEGAERVPVPLEHGRRAVAVRPQGDGRRTGRGREPALRRGDGEGVGPLGVVVPSPHSPSKTGVNALMAGEGYTVRAAIRMGEGLRSLDSP